MKFSFSMQFKVELTCYKPQGERTLCVVLVLPSAGDVGKIRLFPLFFKMKVREKETLGLRGNKLEKWKVKTAATS